MIRRVLYVAHALRPTDEEIRLAGSPLSEHPTGSIMSDGMHRRCQDKALRANLDRAMAWLSWLRRSFPETTFIAPWIAEVLSNDGREDREAGMRDNLAVIERCDGIVLCGPRISEGMRREMEHGVAVSEHWADGACRFEAYDLTGRTLPLALAACPFAEWASELLR